MSETRELVERLYATTDAAVWAEEFVKVAEAGATIDFGLMVGWFANAMETMRSHLLRERPELAAPDRDFVILPRDALYLMLGQYALPPWGPGGELGADFDCAPIASALDEWVKEHDLSALYLGLFGPTPEPSS